MPSASFFCDARYTIGDQVAATVRLFAFSAMLMLLIVLSASINDFGVQAHSSELAAARLAVLADRHEDPAEAEEARDVGSCISRVLQEIATNDSANPVKMMLVIC